MGLRKLFQFREEQDPELVKPFLEHLEDLRWTLVRMVVTLVLMMILSFIFRGTLTEIVQRPLMDVSPEMARGLQNLGPADPITISFKLAFYAGIIISFPFQLYYMAAFILPGLTQKERRYVIPGVLVGFGLFMTGVLFCYYIVLPQALAFFFKDAQGLGWNPTWTVREYYSFVTQFVLAFGLSFEMPVVIMVLVKIGILSHGLMVRTRAYAVVLILMLAAIITPTTDILTLVFMSGPMLVLYEICIWLAWWLERKERRALRDR